jgi:predicted nucleic acid-binding protein
MKVFLDVNVFIDAAGREHPHQMPSARLIHERGAGRLEAVTDADVLQETLSRVWRVQALPDGIALCERILQLVPDILTVSKDDLVLAIRLLGHQPVVEPRDATHAAVMLTHGLTHLYSSDQQCDLMPGWKRLEPSGAAFATEGLTR